MPIATQSIREIVATQSSAAAVLERFEIDLCERGDTPLEEACAELQLSVEQVLEKLADAAANERGAIPVDLAKYSLTRLIQHIVRAHHQSVRRELPRLIEMAHKLTGKHGNHAPELKMVEALLETLRAEMIAHLEKEEQILFPYIAQMEDKLDSCGSQACACFHGLAKPVEAMIREHGSAQELVAEMHRLTNGFEVPDGACPTHVALFAGLRSFENDLRQYVHLEDDLLFPRAVKMEGSASRRR